MTSKAITVEQYLAELPADRRKAIEAVRQIILKKVDDLALDVIGQAIKRMPARKYIEHCEAATSTARERPSKKAEKSADAKASSKSAKRVEK